MQKPVLNPQYALLADEDYERQTLGLLLYGPYVASQYIGMLQPEAFYTPKHQAIFNAMKRIVDAKEELDLLKLNEQLPKIQEEAAVNYADLADLRNEDNDSNDLLGLIKRVDDLRVRREIQKLGFELVKTSQDRFNDIQRESELLSRQVQRATEGTSHQYITLAENAASLIAGLGQPIHGLLTGFREIDNIGGLPLHGLTVVGAGTSQGKSAFAICLAVNAARAQHTVAYISIEMSAQEITQRALAVLSRVSCSTIRSNVIDDLMVQAQINEATAEIAMGLGGRIIMEENRSTTLEQIKQSIRHLNHTRHVDVVVVDYLQIMSIQQLHRNENVEQLLALASRELHNLAKDLKISVIVLSQLNRDREDCEPQLSRLRDSNQIADAADCVILLYRPEKYHKYYTGPFKNYDTENTALVKLAKNRMGPTIEFICGFDPACTLFYDIDKPRLLEQANDSFFN